MIGVATGICFGQGAGTDTLAPSLLGAEVGNVAANIIVLSYNDQLDGSSVPDVGDYSLSGTSLTVSSVGVASNRVSLTLSGDVEAGESILLSYTSGVSPVRDVSLNEAVNLTDEAVTNNTGVVMLDSYGDSVPDSYGNTITMPH